MTFYICRSCGNVIVKLNDSGVKVSCCGTFMEELVPGTTDAATEKHVPSVKVDGNKVNVQVGDVEHPMVEGHYIQFIILETDKGYSCVNLTPEDKPVAEFIVPDGEKPVAVYEYCNMHGLWKKDI
ncbi:MAG: desulfoferrodoxin Dfx [Lachnospiraceae bacterium]|nr:desulfoferrodoxin Dfx [Lachnospiraceae bacterium]